MLPNPYRSDNTVSMHMTEIQWLLMKENENTDRPKQYIIIILLT